VWVCGGIWWGLEDEQVNQNNNNNDEEESAQEAQTLRALAVVRFGHRPPNRPPADTNPQTGPITIHCAAAS